MEAESMLETNNHTNAWQGFKTGRWNKNIDVREFIQLNYSLYEGDDEFLEGPTKATETLWDQVMQLSKKNVSAVACGIWILKWHRQSLLMTLVT